MLLRLWRRPAAAAPVRPLAWEPPYATGAALEKTKNQKRKKKKKMVSLLNYVPCQFGVVDGLISSVKLLAVITKANMGDLTLKGLCCLCMFCYFL